MKVIITLLLVSLFYNLGSDHLTSRGGGGFEKNILALIFVKKNILASTQTKKNSLTLGMRKTITALLRDKNQLSI